MKQILLLISIFLLFFTANANAQLKPAQSQYLVEKGVLINPSFEQGYKGWVITGCTKSLVTETPYLNKSLKLTCTNETFSIKQVSASLIDFKNQQGAFDLQIKTTASGVNVSSITNGVRDNAYSVINSTEFKRFKEIGFIVGGTDNGIEVYSDTNFTGEIVLDNVKLGLGNLTQEISGAHFVGKIELNNDCAYSRASTSHGTMLDVNTCSAGNIVGSLSLPDNPLEGGLKILNKRTDGYYKVGYYGLTLNTAGGICQFSLSKDTSYAANGQSWLNATNSSEANIDASIRFDESDDGHVYVINKNTSGLNCNLYGSSTDAGAWTVHFFPDSKNTIAVQKSQSPNYAGFLSFSFMDGDLQGHLPADGRCVAKGLYPDYDLRVANLYGDCDAGTGANTGYNLPDMRGYFPRMVDTTSEGTAGVNPDNTLIGGKQADQNASHRHKERVSVNSGGGGLTNIAPYFNNTNSTVPSSGVYTDYQGGNEARPSAISLMAYVRMSDNNLVVGTFEQIRSDDLIKSSADSGSGQTLTNAANIVINFSNVIKDSENNITIGSDWKYTAKKKESLTISGMVEIPIAAFNGVNERFFIKLFKNGSPYIPGVSGGADNMNGITPASGSTNIYVPFGGVVELEEGDYFQVIANQSSGSIISSTHKLINIQEIPTKESIVANLMQGQTTKCQTKYLSANTTSTGNIADLTFNNMTIGKKYISRGQIVGLANHDTRVRHNGKDIAQSYAASSVLYGAVNTGTFTALSTSLTVFKSNSVQVSGNGDTQLTWLELCELPDTVISTTEF